MRLKRLKKLLCFACLFFLIKYLFNLWNGSLECKLLQKPTRIVTNNFNWQIVNTLDGRVSLLNAYLDTRLNGTVVLINSNGPDLGNYFGNIFCQFYYDNDHEKPYFVKVSSFRSLWDSESKSKNMISSFFGCFDFKLQQNSREMFLKRFHSL